ncbi:MAG: ECF transporter S component [Treponema sp.]|nr:ECF transporter S component [Treponema sp.]
MNNNVSFTRKLVLTAALSALIIVLGITKLGLIPLGPAASITILHVPIILAACLIGLPYALFTGAVFGIMSLVQAAMSPSGILDPLFVNPLVSVLPRMLVGLIAWALWVAFNKIPKLPKTVSAGITAFLSTVCHTLLVIGSLYLFQGAATREGMGGMGYFAVIGVLAPQAALEAVAATIICSAVYVGLFVSSKRKSKLSEETVSE